MENEPNIFAKDAKAKTKTEEGEPKKSKTGLIVGIVIGALVAIGAIVAIVLVLVLGGRPDYEQMEKALRDVSEDRLSTELTSVNMDDVVDGDLSKTRHDRVAKEARELASKMNSYADEIEESLEALEAAKAGKSEEIEKQYESYKKKAESLMPKLRTEAKDIEKYVEFGDRYYGSDVKLMDSGDYEKVAGITDEEIERVYAPLLEANSEQIKSFGQTMADYTKIVVHFYTKYVDYLTEKKEVTEEIQTEMLKDIEDLQDSMDQFEKDIEDLGTVELLGSEMTNEVEEYEEALAKLAKAINAQNK